ncbi:short-chain dehydrogenase/reductase SDR [Chloroherpeton thalassium ATCC 35110]|uniref:Short-chain dehydrogenase/reductase SDR n=1 Tax=Chloroherpeton thalassium (strain ATCC 35110 / GB-78) TaxID=517418 RepID=B3QTS7_CHLT3|nr:SDR family oxidoreductase [Chloroherpeton thalassium]ACF14275.1 short-chain dehydrogenase/reductase SDR [Chloroherpeton thalassium ATCC 35110]
MKRDATQKVCFITGASGRLGREIAISLAGRGYAICFTYFSSEERAQDTLDELQRISPSSTMIYCDVAKVESIQKAFEFFRTQYSRLDLAITNASNFFPTLLPNIAEKDWDNLVNTNLKGTFFTMQEAVKIMQAQDFTSRIITITDISAELVWRRFAPYTVSKSGIQHLTKIFAKEFAPKILVNSIAPGTLLLNPDRDTAYEAEILKKIPLQKFGSPNDIVQAVMFLVDSEYITGEILRIDGGRRLY